MKNLKCLIRLMAATCSLHLGTASAQMGAVTVEIAPTNSAPVGTNSVAPATTNLYYYLYDTIGAPSPDKTSTNIWGDISLWTGAKFSNPYTINGSTVQPAGSTSDGYLEIELSTRYIVRSGPKATDWVMDGPGNGQALPTGTLQWPITHFWQYMPDIDSRLGYIFRGSSAPTNYNASTIVGSADFYSDTSIGVPILRYGTIDGSFKNQLSLEGNGAFATDKNALTIHPSAFVGLGWEASYLSFTSTNRGYWVARGGWACIDQPAIIAGTDTVQLNNLKEPAYNFRGCPSLGVVATYPLNSTVSLQAGVNAYFTSRDPSSWNASLGVTLDLDKFFGAVLKAF